MAIGSRRQLKSKRCVPLLIALSLLQFAIHFVCVESFTGVVGCNHHRGFAAESLIKLGLFGSKQRRKSGIIVPITEVESHIDWAELLEGDDRRITAVNFHASWCKFCQKFKSKWYGKCVRRFGDRIDDASGELLETGSVRFASVEYGANQKLCRSLRIKELPTVQFYSKGQLLSSFPCGPKGFATVQAAMKHYLEATQEELDREAAAWETKNTLSIDARNPDAGMHTNKEAHDEAEPALFLRKRDRLKKKLGRQK